MIISKTFILWITTTYVCVLVAMTIDFLTGVRKARKGGHATRSRGYKMTCDKAVKYFLPMMCLSCVDLLAQVFLIVPFLTMAMGAFNIFCEWKSVMESTHEKQEIKDAAETVKVVIKNKDDIAELLSKLIEKSIMAETKELDHQQSKERDHEK